MRFLFFCCLFLSALPLAAQSGEIISASNLARLQPDARVNFADLPGDHGIGFFAAADDGSEFAVFDKQGHISVVNETGSRRSWSYRGDSENSIFSLIDARYLDGAPLILYLLDDEFYVNQIRLAIDAVPAALYAAGGLGDFVIEAVARSGETVFLRFALGQGSDAVELLDVLPFPAGRSDEPQARLGRIDFPLLVMSGLADSSLTVNRYPDAFTFEGARQFKLEGGPAVFGAINATGSHLAWIDPRSENLNLLDLDTGESRVAAALDGDYAQYHMLTADASAVVVVNLDFRPEVVAWDLESGRRYDLGEYRNCARIPDKAAMSADGTALIIGCDTGLEVWRISEAEER